MSDAFDQEYFNIQKAVPAHKVLQVFDLLDVPLPSKKHVLDVGCGKGLSPLFFAERGNRVFVTDISQAALVFQNAHAELRGQVLLADVNGTWPLADSCLDVIFCHEVIEHLPPRTAFFREAKRVLAPGGVLVLKTPNGWDLKRAIEPLRGRMWYADRDPTHCYYYSPPRLRAALASAGFVNIKVRSGTEPFMRLAGKAISSPPCFGHGLIGCGSVR
jgi:SAM-dependent methyltransferase